MDKNKVIVGALAVAGAVACIIYLNHQKGNKWHFGLTEAACFAGGVVLAFITYKKMKS